MTSEKPHARERTIVLILAGAQFSHLMDFMVMMPLGPQLMRLYGITPRAFGLVVSIYTFSAALSCLGATLIMDRFDRKRILITVYSGLLVGTFLCGVAPTFGALLGARVITGVFGGLLQAVILSFVGDVVPPERRGRATGVVMAAFATASVAGVPAGLWVASRFGWHAVFLGLAAMTAANLALAYRFLPAARNLSTQTGNAPDHWTTLGALLRTRETWLSMAVILAMMAIFCFFPFVSPYLVNVVGITESDLSTIYLFAGLASFMVSLLSGRLADRFGPKWVLLVSSLLSAPAVVALANLGRSTLLHATMLNTIFSAVGAGRMTPTMTLINNSARPRQRGAFMTLTAAAQQLGAAFWSYTGGLLLEEKEGSTTGGLTRVPLLGWIVVGGLLASTVLAFFLGPPEELGARERTELPREPVRHITDRERAP